MESAPRTDNTHSDRFDSIKILGETPLHKREIHEKNEIVEQTFLFFRDFLEQQGYTENLDNTAAYRQLPNKKIIARREDPRRIFDLFINDTGYSIGFDGDRYANCVEWNPHSDGSKNIHNAFMEGFTNRNGVVAVIGFDPDQNRDLIKMEDSTQNFHGLDRSGVRSYQGTVTRDQVHFITIRIPAHLLPERYLSEAEIEAVDHYLEELERTGKGTPAMIFRTYLPPVKITH